MPDKDFTTRDLVTWLGGQSIWLLVAFTAIPLLATFVRLVHGPGNGGRGISKYIYSALIYLVCFPGMFSAVLTGYSLFFEREDLRNVNPVVYLVPIASMVVTLVIIRKSVDFDDIPGFDRISGLMTMIAITFVLVLAIQKTRILLVFFGSIPMLIALVVGLFALLKWGTYMLFRGSDQPKQAPPTFPPLPPI